MSTVGEVTLGLFGFCLIEGSSSSDTFYSTDAQPLFLVNTYQGRLACYPIFSGLVLHLISEGGWHATPYSQGWFCP